MLEILFSILLSFLCYLGKANEFPKEIITSVTLSFDPMVGVLGSSLTATCTAVLSFPAPGCDIEYDYGFTTQSVAAGISVKPVNSFTMNPFNLSLAGEHTCTVTITTDGDFCTNNVSGHDFPPKSSAAVMLRVQFPSDLITEVTLSFKQMAACCNATLSVDVSGAIIEFSYGSVNKNVSAVAGYTQIDSVNISSVTFSSLNQYNCTVTVTAPGVCGGGGSEPACPTKTSASVLLPIKDFNIESVNISINPASPSLTVGSAEMVTFTCSVVLLCSGTCDDTTVTISWTKDNVPVFNKSDEMITNLTSILNTSKAITETIAVSDAGSYQCHAELPSLHPVSSHSEILAVTIPSTLMPTVSLTSASITVDVGSSVTLICSPSLSGASLYNGAYVNFQYQFGGNVVHNESKVIKEGVIPNNSLAVTMNTTSAGTYICTVTVNGQESSTIMGSSASGKDTAQIIALIPSTLMPTVSLTPASRTVDVGSSVILTCSPSLSDANIYNGANVNFWYVRGSSVLRNVNKTISSGNVPTDSLNVTIDTSSTGTYTCTVTINGQDSSTITGKSTSGQNNSMITAQFPSGLIMSASLSPPNPTGMVADSVTFTCTATLSVNVTGAMIEFDYGFDNNAVTADAETTQTDMVTIFPVTITNAGNDYTCTVTVTALNVCGESESEPSCPSMTSNTATLTVQFPSGLLTAISLSPSNPTGTVGSSVNLTCTATLSVNISGAMIEFNYGFDSSIVTADEDTTQTDNATLSPVTISSADDYTCTVTVTAPGVCGDGSESPCPTSNSDPLTLKVQFTEPIITGNNATSAVGGPAHLACNLTSHVPDGATVTRRWTKGSANLTNSSPTYIIPSVNSSNAGVYSCEVTFKANISNVLPSMTLLNVTLTIDVSQPAVFRNPNKPSYYPGENVTLMCVLDDNQVDEDIEYRWNFAQAMSLINGSNFNTSSITRVLHFTDAGNYTCYANTSNPYTKESQGYTTTIRVSNITMEVTVTSNMKTVLDITPYNTHTVKCTVNHKSFPSISGTLMFSFIRNGTLLKTENESISGDPGPFVFSSHESETNHGTFDYLCNVTLMVEDVPINSSRNRIRVDVVGPKPPAVPTMPTVNFSTTTANVSWTVPEVTYDPESYTVYCAPEGNCHLNDSDMEGLKMSDTVYTQNDGTLTSFFFQKHVFSVTLVDLTPSTNYCCVVVASNSHSLTMSELFQFQTKADFTAVVIAVVLVVLLTLIIVACLSILIYWVFYKKKYKNFKLSSMRHVLDSKPSTERMGAMELKLLEEESRFQIFNYPMGEAISAADFPDYVKKKGIEAIEEEYEELQNFEYKSHDVSSTYENRPKDRFQNIYPFDENRVTLRQMPGDDSSDYINASFVGNYSESRAYIAAQGPLPNTVDDFWRMVWEYELCTVIMLTQLEESGKEKCTCYWPEVGTDTMGLDNELELKLVSQTASPQFVTRKFTLAKTGDDSLSPLSVIQYHFTAWPDHGVPDDKTCITSFISFVRKKHPPSGPPLLVHCSAGVGRTGTFIVLDTMLQRMKTEGTIDIRGYVNQIRANRVKMVQTALQYVYIHEALSEYLVCGDTSFAAMNARAHIRNLGAVEDGKTGFQEQFKLLEKLDLLPYDPCMSDGDNRPEKNRYTYNLPYNLNRVRLWGMLDDYINASWVNGYKNCGMFLATQAPLERTVEDFWRMIWENQSHAIVMLCCKEEGEEESDKKQVSYQYWPEEVEGTERFGLYEVTLKSEQCIGDYIVRNLTISMPDKNESSAVTQYHYLRWPEGSKPKETAFILKMVAELVKTQATTGNKGITVMCNDGVGRTGAFICIYSQLERIKTEATADIFQFVKCSRIQRAGLVRTLDEYVFCYEVVADYNDDMSLYDNFKYVV